MHKFSSIFSACFSLGPEPHPLISPIMPRSLSLATATLFAAALLPPAARAAGTAVAAGDSSGKWLTFVTLEPETANFGLMNLVSQYIWEQPNLAPGPNPFEYAFVSFRPTLSGTYNLGILQAGFDPTMIVYQGVSALPADPSTSVLGINDDISYIVTGPDPYNDYVDLTASTDTYLTTLYGPQNGLVGIVDNDPNNSDFKTRMPFIGNVQLSNTQEYLIVVSTYFNNSSGFNPVLLPITFFVEGAGVADFAPVPEPSAYGIALGGLALAAAALRRRRKA